MTSARETIDGIARHAVAPLPAIGGADRRWRRARRATEAGMRAKWMVVGAVLAVGCLGTDISAPLGVGKPDSVPGAEESGRPARAGDLELRASGPSPVGKVVGAHAGEYPLRVEVVNRTRDMIDVDDVHAVVTVQRDGAPLAGCEIGEEDLDLPELLAAEESARTTIGLPCGLEPGDHEVVVTLVLGAPSATEVSAQAGPRASIPLRVDPEAPWFFLDPATFEPEEEPLVVPERPHTLAPDMPLP